MPVVLNDNIDYLSGSICYLWLSAILEMLMWKCLEILILSVHLPDHSIHVPWKVFMLHVIHILCVMKSIYTA